MSLTVDHQSSSNQPAATTATVTNIVEQEQQQQLNFVNNNETIEQQFQQHKEAGVNQARTENKYCVRYEGNNSKRWDWREIWIDADYMEELYEPSALVPGYKVLLPWQQKNSITHWNAVVVDPSTVSKYTTKLPSIIVVMKIVYCRQTKCCNI